jgi:hypothetical protein
MGTWQNPRGVEKWRGVVDARLLHFQNVDTPNRLD